MEQGPCLFLGPSEWKLPLVLQRALPFFMRKLKSQLYIEILKHLISCWMRCVIILFSFLIKEVPFVIQIMWTISIFVFAHCEELSIPGLQCKTFWFWTCQRWSRRWENSCIYPSDGNLWLCCPGVCDDRLVWLDCLYHHSALCFIGLCVCVCV